MKQIRFVTWSHDFTFICWFSTRMTLQILRFFLLSVFFSSSQATCPRALSEAIAEFSTFDENNDCIISLAEFATREYATSIRPFLAWAKPSVQWTKINSKTTEVATRAAWKHGASGILASSWASRTGKKLSSSDLTQALEIVLRPPLSESAKDQVNARSMCSLLGPCGAPCTHTCTLKVNSRSASSLKYRHLYPEMHMCVHCAPLNDFSPG